MNSVDIKNNMMKLWKNVFHDSDAYISLIFDNYFDPDMVEYHEDNGHIVSALLGIPYNFGCGDRTMKGLYLCGLATIDEYRHRGIMNNLLERINNKAKERGYVFTFLIPANDGLINYYSIRGYETGMYRIEDRYTDVHDFDMDYYSELNKYDERVKNLKINLYRSLRVEIFDILHCDIYKEVIDFIYDSEHRISTYISLLHSKYDIEILIKECILSGGKIYISRNKENRISGAAFVSIDDKKRVHVKKIYHIDKASFYKILNYVKKHNQSFPISVFSYPEEVDRHVLWQKVYGAPNPDGGMLSGTYGISEKVYNVGNHAKPYGMIKILNLREILIFIAGERKDLKFSILIKRDPNGVKTLKCNLSDGNIFLEDVDLESANADEMGCTVLNEREFIELLFRKKGSSNLIQEAFGIPRLPLNMSLLLD